MNNVFGNVYASSYDALYQDIDYDGHYSLMSTLLRARSDRKIERVLDVGCGTGQYAKRFTDDGYKVFGVDQSEEMLEIARARVPGLLTACSKAASFSLGGRLDAAIMVGDILSYHQSIDDVCAALLNVRNNLLPGAPFYLDAWCANAVLSEGPGDRAKVVNYNGADIIRIAKSSLDLANSLCTVTYDVMCVKDDVMTKTRERHVMRYFTPSELGLLLKIAGFRDIRVLRGYDIEVPISNDHWHIVGVCTA